VVWQWMMDWSAKVIKIHRNVFRFSNTLLDNKEQNKE